jgi:hypothetical protein
VGRQKTVSWGRLQVGASAMIVGSKPKIYKKMLKSCHGISSSICSFMHQGIGNITLMKEV